MATGIPDVPPTTDGMRQFLLALKGAVENMELQLGDLEGQVTGDTGDITPPAAPVGLTASSASGGVSLSWTNPGDEDLLLVEVWENTSNTRPNPNTQPSKRVGTVLARPGEIGTYDRSGVTTGVHLFYWVRAVDTSGNPSDFNAVSGVDVYVTAATGDGVAPSAPTSVTAAPGFQDIWLFWTNPADSDLDHVLVFENTTNNSSTANIVASVTATPSSNGSYDRAGLGNNVTRYYWLKAVDKDGNASGFSAVASTTTGTIDPTDLGTVVGFGAPAGLSVNSALGTNGDGMQVVNILTSWTAIVDSRLSFYEVAISEGGGSYIVFPTNDAFYNVRGRGSTSYNVKVRAVDRNGNRTAYSSVVNITSVTPTITPADAVNAGSTLVAPGKIQLFGSTALSSWLYSGDQTKIEGGKIGANTIAANSIAIGARGLDILGLSFEGNTSSVGSGVFTSNEIAWTSGTISYVNDAGTPTTAAIAANHTSFTGSTVYIYWVKGAGTLSATTTPGTAYTANTVVLCTYGGGTNVNATYGRTIIDGSSIKAASVNADRIQAGTITATQVAAHTLTAAEIAAGTITATEIAANTITAAQIAANTITAAKIAAGTITATEIVAAGISNLYTNSAGAVTGLTSTSTETVNKNYTSGDNDIVLVIASVFFTNNEGAATRTATLEIWRDTTMIYSTGTDIRPVFSKTENGIVADTPPTNSSVTYRVKCRTPDGLNMDATTSAINVIRWRR